MNATVVTRVLALVPPYVDVTVTQEKQHAVILPFAINLTTRTLQHLDIYLYSSTVYDPTRTTSIYLLSVIDS